MGLYTIKELKNNNALRKSLFLFNIIKYPLIVRLSSFLMHLFLKFKLPITPIIKSLLFDQFCVGINEKESMMTVKKLSKFHLKSILHYHVEGYESEKSFICSEWSHTYNFKNNHTISAKFEEYPIGISSKDFVDLETPSIGGPAKIIFDSPLILAQKEDGALYDKRVKK